MAERSSADRRTGESLVANPIVNWQRNSATKAVVRIPANRTIACSPLRHRIARWSSCGRLVVV